MNKLKYYRPEHGQDKDDPYEVETIFGVEEWGAEVAAQDYFDNHDGREASWPMLITVFDDHTEKTYEVELESAPVFAAREKTE